MDPRVFFLGSNERKTSVYGGKLAIYMATSSAHELE